MLIHVVCFKYRPEADADTRAEHRARLQALKDQAIDGLLDLEVGEDVVRSARSYDTALVVRLRDRAALDAYQVHPQHVPVAQYGANACVSIVAVDFELPGATNWRSH